jgi:hypothetical protein
MAGEKGGFLGGLLEGVGTSLIEAKQQKAHQEEEQNKMLASIYMKALDADPYRDTASLVLPKLGELLTPHVQTLFGLKLGGSGKNKGGSPIDAVLSGLAQAYPDRAEAAQRATKAKSDEAEAQAVGRTTGNARGETLAVDRYVQTHPGSTQAEGFEYLFGRRAAPSGFKVVAKGLDPKSVPADAKDFHGNPIERPEGVTFDSFQVGLNQDGTPDMRYTPGKAEKATKAPTVRSRLQGDALQAYDMNAMLNGRDPDTGKEPDDPAEKARLVAAGKEMQRSRNLKDPDRQRRERSCRQRQRLARQARSKDRQQGRSRYWPHAECGLSRRPGICFGRQDAVDGPWKCWHRQKCAVVYSEQGGGDG